MNMPDQNTVGWKDINWKSIDYRISKLQRKIYTLTKDNDIVKVRKAQKDLLNSHEAKLLAVRKVTQENRGKKTAGVDGLKVLTPQKRLALAKDLRITGKAKPVKRIYIPKAGTNENRPLGIPVFALNVKLP